MTLAQFKEQSAIFTREKIDKQFALDRQASGERIIALTKTRADFTETPILEDFLDIYNSAKTLALPMIGQDTNRFVAIYSIRVDGLGKYQEFVDQGTILELANSAMLSTVTGRGEVATYTLDPIMHTTDPNKVMLLKLPDSIGVAGNVESTKDVSLEFVAGKMDGFYLLKGLEKYDEHGDFGVSVINVIDLARAALSVKWIKEVSQAIKDFNTSDEALFSLEDFDKFSGRAIRIVADIEKLGGEMEELEVKTGVKFKEIVRQSAELITRAAKAAHGSG